jgi:hypothetical protein
VKKSSLLAVGAGLILAGLLWKFSLSRAPETPASETAPPEALARAVPGAPPPELPSPRLQALRQGPREPLAPKAGEKVSPECVSFWTSLRSLNLDESFRFPPKAMSLPPAGPCGSPPQALAAAQERYARDCAGVQQMYRPEMDQAQWMAAVSPCYMAVSLYRANLTEWLTKDQKLSDITDPKVLSDKLAARLFENPAGAADVAERLLELEPELYPAAKVAAVSRFLEAQTEGGGDTRNPVWNKLEDAIARMKKMNPSDPTATEMEIVAEIMRSQDPAGMRNRIEALREKNPALADYFTAWMEYKGNNTEGAVRLLEAMIAKGNQDPRVRQTLARIQKGEKDAFQMQISFPMEMIAPAPPK